ncbi:cation transport protein-domain-containing protein [Mycena maculata]|uniref:Potassium transport protein n=1 Tax=Mycena maculata TaxID=230809 RepID=A0AAD7JUB1_9AGAR|nr:cation transport protein-domain-containing protein [Mycena maculata]
MHSTWKAIRKQLNFYRVHILFFTFTPLIFSGIFYASNGQYHISYIDGLFNCVSAMTVCGLATVDLSSLTPWQQVILFIQMCLGSPVVVSWVMVYLRKYYFAKKFEHIIEAAKAKALAIEETEKTPPPWPRRINTLLSRSMLSAVQETSREGSRSRERTLDQDEKPKKKGFMRKLRPDMIRRMDHPPQLVNPSGWISEGAKSRSPEPQDAEEPERREGAQTPHTEEEGMELERPRHLTFAKEPVSSPKRVSEESLPPESPSAHLRPGRRLSDPGRASPFPSSPITSSFPRFDTIAAGEAFPRTQTVEFAPDTIPRRARLERPPSILESVRSQDRRSRRGSWVAHETLTQNTTTHTYPSVHRTKHSGFGGFPMPHEIAHDLFSHFFPKLQRKLTRTMTLPRTTTLTSQRGEIGVNVKPAPYISFDAIVGRNSAFQQLTKEQQDELGGVEYRALKALLWIVAGYHIGIQLVAFTVIAPYMAQSRWAATFLPPMQHKKIMSTWFSLFQVVSAYTNTGMSLVDQSMVPFQRAYPTIVFMVLLVLAGNTAFPIFLRLLIWILSCIVPAESRTSETLHFLLDHPRRCFIYLFPSHQTWFLVTVVLTLNLTDWFFFMVLDIGNPAIEVIPLNVRFIIGLLQAIAVRAAGFATVTLSALAPAVKVLYLIMMYISVYPIAMSVRSTNVYEEQSLGVFRDNPNPAEEDDFQPTDESRVTVWSRYLAMHARKQLAFDMWWLGLAVFLVCIIERHAIDLEANYGWFNIFSVVFELVSAYGTVGLSLGIPTANYSFSGAFTPLSKLIVCFVMIRGRHRGLPVAIDRAVMLPMEFAEQNNTDLKRQDIEPDEDHEHPAGTSGHEKSSDMESRLRRNLRRSNTEEIALAERRRSAAKLDHEGSFGY